MSKNFTKKKKIEAHNEEANEKVEASKDEDARNEATNEKVEASNEETKKEATNDNVKTSNEEETKPEATNLDVESLTCPTSVLAAQMRKFMPSTNITNSKSSINLLDEVFSEEKKVSNRSLKKRVTFASLHKISDTSEIAMEELLKTDDDEEALKTQRAESIVRSFPVSMEEKRARRNTVMLFTRVRKPWSDRVKEYFYELSDRLQHIKLWHEDLKLIEGRFGTSVVSYFVLIRWLLLMDLIILALNFFFIILPQYTFTPMKVTITANLTFNETITADFNYTKVLRNRAAYIEKNTGQNEWEDFSDSDWPQFEAWDEAALNNSNSSVDLIKYCHSRYVTQIENVTSSGILVHFQNLLQGTGLLERTMLFIGSFPTEDITFLGRTYYTPLAVIWVLIISFAISLFMMIQYATFGIKEAFMTHQGFRNFSNEIFCGWDYCIQSSRAAEIHSEKIVVELKSNLSEARRKKKISRWRTFEWCFIYFTRIVVNIIVLLYIIACYILIYKVALYQLQAWKTNELEQAGFRTFLIQYLPSITIIIINFVSCFLFDFLVSFEEYHGQVEVNISLVRNSFLSLSSLIVLISTFHQQIICKPRDVCGAGKSYDCRTPRCWETYVGQQLYKLSLTQLFCFTATFLFVDIPRNFIVQKYDNKYTRIIGRPAFFLPTEVLEPIYSQAILWLGVFYSPMLPAIIVVVLLVLFYSKKEKVLKYSQPSKSLYKASRFNSAFMTILLATYLVILSVHMYTLVRFRPSLGCSPFRIYNSMIEALRRAFSFFPFDLIEVFTYIFSGWFFTLASILMCVIIYYYWKYIAFLQSMENSLRADLQLISQDKQFLLKKLEELAKKSE